MYKRQVEYNGFVTNVRVGPLTTIAEVISMARDRFMLPGSITGLDLDDGLWHYFGDNNTLRDANIVDGQELHLYVPPCRGAVSASAVDCVWGGGPWSAPRFGSR